MAEHLSQTMINDNLMLIITYDFPTPSNYYNNKNSLFFVRT